VGKYLAGTLDLESESCEKPQRLSSWATDPVHPVAVSEELAGLIACAELHVSHTAADVRTWGTRAAAFLQDQGRQQQAAAF
jgi:hypothetical protein